MAKQQAASGVKAVVGKVEAEAGKLAEKAKDVVGK